jgi:hypothetical protein
MIVSQLYELKSAPVRSSRHAQWTAQTYLYLVTFPERPFNFSQLSQSQVKTLHDPVSIYY